MGIAGRLAKWVRRRPDQAGLAALAALAVTAAFAGLLVHQRLLQIEINRTAQAAELARRQKNLADGNYRDARAAIQAILDCYNDPEFATLPRRGELRRAQAEKALIFYDRLLAGAESRDPVVQLDTARAAREAAMAQYAAGRFQDAVASLKRSVRLIDAALATRPNDPEVMREQLQSRTRLAMIVWLTSKSTDSALAELRRALDIAEALVRASPHSVDARSDLAWALHDQGSILLESGRLREALPAHRRAVAINRELAQEKPSDVRRHVVLAENLNNVGLLAAKGEPDQAEAAYSEAAALLEAALRDKSNSRARGVAGLGSQQLGKPRRAARPDRAGATSVSSAGFRRSRRCSVVSPRTPHSAATRSTCMARGQISSCPLAGMPRPSPIGTVSWSSTTSRPTGSPTACFVSCAWSARRITSAASMSCTRW